LKTSISVNRIFTKIFIYEFRRIVLHKFYIGLFLICAAFHLLILRMETIKGISHTAPFSAWSFGVYLAHSVPLLFVIIFFFLYRLYSGNDRRVQILISATSVNPKFYLLIRCAAIWAALFFLIVLIEVEGILFLWNLFPAAFSPFSLLLPALLVFFPALSFAFGLGLCCIRIHPVFFFLGALVGLLGESVFTFFSSKGSLWTGFFSLSGTSYFFEYPLTLPDPDAPFICTKEFLIARLLLFLAGCLGIGIGILGKKEHFD